MQQYQVRAIPTGPGTYSIECSDCGPIGVADETETDTYCLDHLETHGVDVSGYRA